MTRSATPGHYIDLTDDAKAMGIVALDELPVTREEYDNQSGEISISPCTELVPMTGSTGQNMSK